MATKEIAIGKRAKISKAQQNMMIAVFGASVILGVAIALVSYFIQQISFNTKVIMAEEETIVEYSNVIKSTGICKSPKGTIYSDKELSECDPDSIEVSEIPDTLRSNILEGLASNKALNSVPAKYGTDDCINPETGRNYTYKELNKKYTSAEGDEALVAASELIRNCSALRVVPEALPAEKNEEALLGSLKNIFIMSNWEYESLSPSGSEAATSIGSNLNTIPISLSIEASGDITMNVLNNIERSIREFDIETASIEWSGSNSLTLSASAMAYYMNPTTFVESTKTITSEGGN